MDDHLLNDMITSLTDEQAGVDGMTISDLNDMIASLTEQAGVDGMTISDLNDMITSLNDMITSLTEQAGVDGMTISDLNDMIASLTDAGWGGRDDDLRPQRHDHVPQRHRSRPLPSRLGWTG